MLYLLTFIVNAAFNFALGLLVAHFLGPEGFGRYALAQSIGIMLNMAFIDWVRYSAARFYGERVRLDDPRVRASLDLAFGVSSAGVAVICGFLILAGWDFGLPAALALIVPLVGITNALYDYHAAVTRARFMEKLYTKFVIAKNGLSILLVIGGAWYFRDPAMVLAGLSISLVLAWLSIRGAIRDRDAELAFASRAHFKTFALYALPLVIANSLYQLIPLINRAFISANAGFAETGQFSLPYELGTRLIGTIGTALDMLLFQHAVRAAEDQGEAAARARLSENFGIVLAAAAPLCAGLWFILPSVELLLIPAAFQGAFSAYLRAMLPGLFCFALTLYACNAVFQIKRRTYPVILAALAALAVNTALVARLPAAATGYDYALAQSYALSAALGVSLLFIAAIMPVWPRLRDLAGTAAATAAMALALWPLKDFPPGLALLAAMIALGAAVYAIVSLAFNTGGCRMLARGGGGLKTQGAAKSASISD